MIIIVENESIEVFEDDHRVLNCLKCHIVKPDAALAMVEDIDTRSRVLNGVMEPFRPQNCATARDDHFATYNRQRGMICEADIHRWDAVRESFQ